MNIYRTELNKAGLNILVRERTVRDVADTLANAEEIADVLNKAFKMNRLAEEKLCAVAFDSKLHPIALFEIGHGTCDSSLFGVREILVRMCICGAVSFVVAHNHPSGDPTPSKQDYEATERLKKAADIIGIQLLDHIVIGDWVYGMRERSNIWE